MLTSTSPKSKHGSVESKGIKWVCCKIGSIVWGRCILHFYTKSAKAQRIRLCPNLVAGLVRPQWGSWERESWLGSLGDNPRCNVTVTTTSSTQRPIREGRESPANQRPWFIVSSRSRPHHGPGDSREPLTPWLWPRLRPSPLQLVYCQYIHVTASHCITLSKRLRN